MHQEQCLLTVPELANFLKVSRTKAYELVHTEGFPVIRLGRCMRISKEALINWLEAQM